MYPTSAAYKQAIDSTNRLVSMTGTITLRNNMVIPIGDEDILLGSLYTRDQCVSADDFEIGNTIAGEMGLSLILSEKFEGRNFDNAKIELDFGLEVTPGVFEYVPLGVFYVIESGRKETVIDIKAFDRLIMLDADVKPVRKQGTPYQFFKSISDEVGLILVNSAEEIGAFPNGEKVFKIPYQSNIKTCRDLAGWLAQLLGCFVRMNRAGDLELIRFTGEPNRGIDSDPRYSTSIADFNYGVTKLSMISGQTLYENVKSIDNGNHLELFENPLLAEKFPIDRKRIITHIFDEVTQVIYKPFETEYFGDPSFQAGDHITLVGGVAKNGVNSIITHITWRYRGKQKLKSAGVDPLLKIKSGGEDPNAHNQGTNLVQTKNEDAVTVEEESKIILILSIGLSSSANAQAGLHVVGEASSATVLLEGFFDVGGVRFSTEVKQALQPGWNTITASFVVPQLQEGVHAVRFYLKSTGGAFHIAREKAEFFMVAENLLGGMSSMLPSADIIEDVTFPDFHVIDILRSADVQLPAPIQSAEIVEFPEFNVTDTHKPYLINKGSIIPIMTDYDEPEPHFIVADTSYDGHAPFRAMNKNYSDSWMSELGVLESQISINLGEPKIANYYRITSAMVNAESPSSWILEGSDEGEVWTLLDEQRDVVFDDTQSVHWTEGIEQLEFTISEPREYQLYRWTFTGNHGSTEHITVTEIDLIYREDD